MLLCHKCNTRKNKAEFTRDAHAVNRDGLSWWCKNCNHEHYLANRTRHKEQTRRNYVRRTYGLELEEYRRLISQGCTVCGNTESRIVMDHCHVTNSVRAPLCNGCNVALGAAGDNPTRLRALADYLERHATA